MTVDMPTVTTRVLNVCLSVCRERCGVIKIRQPGVQRHWRERETMFQNGPAGLRRLARKRYIDLGNDHSDLRNDSKWALTLISCVLK